jgi:hypothetical protein
VVAAAAEVAVVDKIHSEGLTPSEIALLDRNAKEASVGVQYTLVVGEGQYITPAFTFVNFDADGDAMSHKRYQVEATYAYRTPVFVFGLNVMYARAYYEEANLVFDKEEEDTVYGVFATGAYKNLFDVQGMDLVGRLGGEVKDADIDFLNSQAAIAGLSLQYRF